MHDMWMDLSDAILDVLYISSVAWRHFDKSLSSSFYTNCTGNMMKGPFVLLALISSRIDSRESKIF
jgi:hypothetical protein